MASPQRSTPGPLPYQTPTTPSYCVGPNMPSCCVPQMAVAARSLVDARLEMDVVTGEEGPRLPQRAVVGAERRAAIAGDEHAGLQPRRLVAPALEHGQADQRLGAGHEDSPRLQGVFVVEGDGGKAHRTFSFSAGPVGGGGARLGRAPRRLKAGSRAAGAPAPNRRAVRRARGSAARRGGPGRPPCAIPGRACIRR